MGSNTLFFTLINKNIDFSVDKSFAKTNRVDDNRRCDCDQEYRVQCFGNKSMSDSFSCCFIINHLFVAREQCSVIALLWPKYYLVEGNEVGL